jgi:hypothetical protein
VLHSVSRTGREAPEQERAKGIGTPRSDPVAAPVQQAQLLAGLGAGDIDLVDAPACDERRTFEGRLRIGTGGRREQQGYRCQRCPERERPGREIPLHAWTLVCCLSFGW